MRFSLTGGQRADVSQAIPLLTGIETGAVIADKGYESNRLLAFIRDQGAEAVIPPKSNRRDPWEYDRELYRERNLIERAFNKLKQWRRIATRYDRKSLYFLSALHLVALYFSCQPCSAPVLLGGITNRPETRSTQQSYPSVQITWGYPTDGARPPLTRHPAAGAISATSIVAPQNAAAWLTIPTQCWAAPSGHVGPAPGSA